MLKIVIHSHIKWIFPLSPYLSDAINTNKPRYEIQTDYEFQSSSFKFNQTFPWSQELFRIVKLSTLKMESIPSHGTKKRTYAEAVSGEGRLCFYYLYCLIITLQSWTRLSVGLPDQRVCLFFRQSSLFITLLKEHSSILF